MFPPFGFLDSFHACFSFPVPHFAHNDYAGCCRLSVPEIEATSVSTPIAGIAFDALFADKGFDIDWIRATSNRRGALAVIPSTAHRSADAM